MKLRYKLLAALVALLGLLTFVFYKGFKRGVKHGSPAVLNPLSAAVLPKEDSEQLVIDPRRHIITINKPGQKSTTVDLPDKVTTVDIHKDGAVKVDAPQWGTEVSHFLGGAFGSDIRLRASVGLNLLYIRRWELGGGLLLDSNIHDTRVFAHVSYNVYSNYYVSGGVDNRQTFHVMAGLKF